MTINNVGLMDSETNKIASEPLTREKAEEYRRQVRDNSCLLNIMLESMGRECPDSLYSMLSSRKVLKVLEDEELLLSARVLFDNNLSIGNASKQIYVHRNTMVYRIEKIQRLIGLDIRKFDDAMTLRALIILYDNIKKF